MLQMKHYLPCSLILAIFMPFFVIAQELTYPDKGFQLEVGTGLRQAFLGADASSIPVYAELHYQLQKFEFGAGYSRGIIALGQDIYFLYNRNYWDPFGTSSLNLYGNSLNETDFIYLLMNYNLKLSKQSFIVGGGFGKYDTPDLYIKSFSVNSPEGEWTNAYKEGSSNYYGFAQIGYKTGIFRSYLAFNLIRRGFSYSEEINHFFNVKLATNLRLKKRAKQPNTINKIENLEEPITYRKYSRFGAEMGVNASIPIDKDFNASRGGIYFEPRLNINDKIILGFRILAIDEASGGIDYRDYFANLPPGKVRAKISTDMKVTRSIGLIGDYNVLEKGKFRLFTGLGIARFKNSPKDNMGFLVRVSNNFGIMRSGLTFNYPGADLPMHLAFQFGFEIGGGFSKKYKFYNKQ